MAADVPFDGARGVGGAGASAAQQAKNAAMVEAGVAAACECGS